MSGTAGRVSKRNDSDDYPQNICIPSFLRGCLRVVCALQLVRFHWRSGACLSEMGGSHAKVWSLTLSESADHIRRDMRGISPHWDRGCRIEKDTARAAAILEA